MEREYKYMVCTRCFTFNHAPYIIDAMNGFTMQETTFPVVTLIVDDASTDGEPEVIRQYLVEHFQNPYRAEETEYAHIICALHKSNSNCEFVVFLLKYNHNSIKKQKLDYLSEWLNNSKYQALCEGDDYWTYSQKLQEQVEYMEDHDDCALVHSKVLVYDETNKRQYSQTKGSKFSSFAELLQSNKVVALTACVRNSVFFDYQKCSLSWKEKESWKMGDYPRWLWIANKYDVHFIDKIVGVYRVLPESASHSKNFDNVLRFIEGNYGVQQYFANLYKVEDTLKDELYINYIKNRIRVFCNFNKFRVALLETKVLSMRERCHYVMLIIIKWIKIKF